MLELPSTAWSSHLCSCAATFDWSSNQKFQQDQTIHFYKFQSVCSDSLTSPMKKRTATSPERTASYCIQVLLIAIRLSKLFPDEKTPMSSRRLLLESDAALSRWASASISTSSVTGSPLARIDTVVKRPLTSTLLTNQGSSLCKYMGHIAKNLITTARNFTYMDKEKRCTSLYANDVSCLPFTVVWKPSPPAQNVAIKGLPSTNWKAALTWVLPSETLANFLFAGWVAFRLSSAALLIICALHFTSPSTEICVDAG